MSNTWRLDTPRAAADETRVEPVTDLVICLRFFTRLPLPATAREADRGAATFAEAVGFVPVAGAIVGLIAGLVLLAASAVGMAPLLAAPLAVATLVAVTGALHEDGLADCADGFGGGRTRERKLDIMRDSRIGTYGACAIALSLYMRAASLAVIATLSPIVACAALVAAASLSRTVSLLPLVLLAPARSDGLGAAAGRPSTANAALAAVMAIAIGLATIPFGVSFAQVTVAVALAAIAGLAVSALAWRQIGGQTGDVAGAAQQIAEIATLLVFAAGGA